VPFFGAQTEFCTNRELHVAYLCRFFQGRATMKWQLLCGLLFSWTLSATSVVVNQSVPLQSLTQAQLRNIFTLRQTQWPDGSAITVLVLPDTSVLHQRFSREQLKLFPYQLNHIWDKHSFSGTGSRPRQVDNAAAMLQQLRQTPGAIGYVGQLGAELGVKEMRIEY
jgi:ABC-type phosphate transport system substrate-binding protein